MKITFKIHYRTNWGQQIGLTGNIASLGNESLDQAFLLEYTEDGFWEGSIEVAPEDLPLSYKYLLIDSGQGQIKEEWGENRNLNINHSAKNVLLKDAWRPQREDQNVFYSSAFQNAICRPSAFKKMTPLTISPQEVKIRFQMAAPQVPSGKQLGIIGNIEELGNWKTNKALLFSNEEHPNWEAEISFPKYRVGKLEYKYCFYDPQIEKVTEIEGGANREVDLQTLFDKEIIILNDQNFTLPDGPWKGAGVAIPVFSLRTAESFGVGEFHDLHKMLDWAGESGFRMVQILPVNDTLATYTWKDSYPYAAISVFALHPIYLHLGDLGGQLPKTYKKTKEKLNALPEVDFEKVITAKLEMARSIYLSQKETFLKDKDYKKYFKENKHWLEAYAVFSYLRDQHKTPDFTKWGNYAKFKKSYLKEFASTKAETYEEIAFYYFLQYHLDRQLRAAADYARSKGMVLKGDLPIGIYRDSVDAWVAPKLYNMDGQAGAPPDPFSEDGQNWGFPTYNWDVMAEDGFLWWKQRMQQLSRYFDTYRIDHILGFFRIWDIPRQHISGILGVFNKALPIRIQEFAQRGIDFDVNRYCQPFINDRIVTEIFGDESEYIIETFLYFLSNGRYRFKKTFDTQRKIKAYIDQEKGKTEAQKKQLLKGLFELTANILFIPDKAEPAQAFHPRMDLAKTKSFEALRLDHQQKIRDLYWDYFYNRQEDFWREEAMKKLPALSKATNMLICGEDLGMVPACVPGVMQELNILSLEIQRMSKNPSTEFLNTEDIPYLSVASPSTHDMSPIRAWWEEESWDQIQRFYTNELKMTGDHPVYCEPYIAQAIVNQHLNWPSMWTVFPLQDLLAMDGRLRRKDPFEERINIPANPNHYWRYRMHHTVEELIEEQAFNRMIYAMLSSAKRI